MLGAFLNNDARNPSKGLANAQPCSLRENVDTILNFGILQHTDLLFFYESNWFGSNIAKYFKIQFKLNKVLFSRCLTNLFADDFL